MQTIPRIDGPIRPIKKWTKIPFILKYGSYISFGMFWFGLGVFSILIFQSLTYNDQFGRYLFLSCSIVWIWQIYKFSEFADIRHARRESMRWLVVERLENKYAQHVFEMLAFFIILTKGQKSRKENEK